MELLVRTLGKHGRWLKDEETQQLLDKDDTPADPIQDLKTKNNRLSVYAIDENKSNLHRVVRAICVGSQKPDNAAYVVFSSKVLEDAGIVVEQVAGTTPDDTVNPLHRDLVLSGKKLVDLTKGMLRDGELGQLFKVELIELVEQGIKDGQLPEQLRDWLKRK